MEVSYKTRNAPKLLSVWIVNVVVFLEMVKGNLDFRIWNTFQTLFFDTVTGYTDGLLFVEGLGPIL